MTGKRSAGGPEVECAYSRNASAILKIGHQLG